MRGRGKKPKRRCGVVYVGNDTEMRVIRLMVQRVAPRIFVEGLLTRDVQ